MKFNKITVLANAGLFFWLFSNSFSGFSQNLIKGIVKDAETNLPLQGASVYWNNTKSGTKTNAEGLFKTYLETFDNELIISYIGFEKKVFSAKEFTNKSDFEILLKRTIYSADEVIVNANRVNEKSGMAYTNIGKEELIKQNAGQDMPIILNFSPSIVTTSDAGAGIGYTGMRIRGTDATRINVMVNGIPINDSESQGVYWVNMPDLASSVSSVQIQRGVGTSANGTGAFGASVNIQSNDYNPKAYAQISSSVGSFNSFKNTLKLGSGLLAGHFTIDGRISKITSDGFVDRAFSDLKSYYISGAYYGKKSFIRLVNFAGKEKTYQSWNGIPKDKLKNGRTFNSFTYENQTDNYWQNHYQLLSTHTLSKNVSFNANLHYTKGKGYYEEFKETDNLANYGISNAVIDNVIINESDLVRQKWLNNNFYGVTYSFDYQSYKKFSATLGGAWNKYDGDHFGDLVSVKEYTKANGLRWYDSRTLKTDFNIYGKINYQFTDKINIFTDLQLRKVGVDMNGTASKLQDISQKHNYSFFNPKIGLNYSISDQWNSYASYSIGQKEPSRTDFVDNATVSTPKSEKLKDLEIGLKYYSKNISFGLNGYLMDYVNQLVVTGAINDVGESIRTNIPKSKRMGIEMEMALNISKKLSWNLNATIAENTISKFNELIPDYEGNYLEKLFKKSDIAFSPNFISGSQLLFKPVKQLEIGLLTKYVSKQYLDNTSNSKKQLDAYLTNDLRLLYNIKPKHFAEINIGFYANNILNEQYESNGYTFSYLYEQQVYSENYYYPQAGRNFIASISLKF